MVKSATVFGVGFALCGLGAVEGAMSNVRVCERCEEDGGWVCEGRVDGSAM